MICVKEMFMPVEPSAIGRLDKQDLVKCLDVINRCLKIATEEEYHRVIMDFASWMGFRYVLYAYTNATYANGYKIDIVNLSNPEEWMDEYRRENFLLCDPVRIEMEKRLAMNANLSFILWDSYDRALSDREKYLVRRRKHYGLEYGCSVYDDSENRDFAFLVSFADKKKKPDARTEMMCRMVVSHMMICRKKLDMLTLFNGMTAKEKAVSEWLVKGKTNWEIAHIMGISENTVKFHLKNIFVKLSVSNRQQAVTALMIAKYLSV